MQTDDDKTQGMTVISAETVVDHYQIIRKIGSGGMGDLYLAADKTLNRHVALKFLAHHLCASADCRVRFKREAQAAAVLDHPNIVLPYDVGEFQGRPYFAMQFVEGQSLRELMKQSEVPIIRAIDIAIQTCDGLRAAHEHGIIHRDVKPSNLLVDSEDRVRIVDFGLASIAGAAQVTTAGSRLGTVGYMSPEQVKGETIDHRTDLFSLGIVLYELIAGRNPFAADNEAAVHHRLLECDSEPLLRYRSGIPPGLQEIINRSLEKDPALRYQSAADMMADLKRLQRDSADPHLVDSADRLPGRPKRNKSRLAIYALIALLIAMTIWQTYRPATNRTVHDQVHLAVIPFANLGSHEFSQAMCDGLMETLTSKLTQLAEFNGWLLVVPASEIREQHIKSAAQAHSIFGVNLAVTGSMQELGYEIRTTLNLVDAASQRQLHSKILDEGNQNVAALQDSTVAELALMLNIQLRPESRRVLAAGQTQSSGAYRAYLEGLGHLRSDNGLAGLDSAQRLFEQAIADDSAYALAYAGLGEVCWRRYSLTNDVAWVEPGIDFSSRALELDDRLAPVLVTLGLVHRQTGQYQEAISYLKRAQQIDSTDNEALVELASTYEALGRLADAESTFQTSIRLRPKLWRGHYNLARFYAYLGRNDEAMRAAAAAESLAPPGTFPREAIGSLYLYLGDYDRAKMLLQKALEIEPHHFAYSNLGVIFQIQEKHEEAAAMYRRALELNDEDFRVWFNLATVYEAMPGGARQAKEAYESAISLGVNNLAVNPNDPELICNLADCFWQVGQRDTALVMTGRAVKLAPNDIEVMVRAGIVYEKAGLREKAMDLVTSAVRRGYALDRIKANTALQSLIAEPRFDSLLTARE
jgi:serine/threonine protein kinase/tetratricopeptide (TPR) repeat protein